jgi:hypothetical protein
MVYHGTAASCHATVYLNSRSTLTNVLVLCKPAEAGERRWINGSVTLQLLWLI